MPIYLYVNAGLNGLFAIWCAAAQRSTSASLGFMTFSNGGLSEYLAVYGGLHAGVAIAFFLFARDSRMHHLGVVFALCLYSPIVLFRMASFILFAPVPNLTLGLAAAEFALLLGAYTLISHRPS